MSTTLSRLIRSASLPDGSRMPRESLEQRLRLIEGVVLAHLPILLLVGAFGPEGLAHAAIDSIPVVALLLFCRVAPTIKWRMGLASVALLSTSAALIHLTGGLIEMHVHLYVGMVLVALLHAWQPYAIAVGFVLVHHIGLSLLAPESVFHHAAGQNNPILWALIHAGLLVAETAAIMVFWRVSDQAFEQMEAEQRLRIEEAQRVAHDDSERAAALSRAASSVAAHTSAASTEFGDIETTMQSLSERVQQVAESLRSSSTTTSLVLSDVEGVSAQTDQLDDAVRQIDEIVEVIAEIADQTNLLALNATIEAASAGEAGKGFAVVAGEVKELASRSAQAASDISSLVESIRSGTANMLESQLRVRDRISELSEQQRTAATEVGVSSMTSRELAAKAQRSVSTMHDIDAEVRGLLEAH